MKFLLSVLLIASLFLVSNCVEDDITSTLKRIESNKLGRTLLDTIQLQLQAGDPVEDLIHLLQDMENELQEAQDTDDKYIATLQNQCDDDISRLVTEIAAAKARIAELKAELEEKIPIRDEKVKIEKEKQEYKEHVEAKVVELDANKVLKDQEWAEEQEQHDSAQFIIEKAKQIIVEALKTGSFLQKSQTQKTVFAQVSEHLHKSAKTQSFKRKSWNSIFSLLSQITAAEPIQSDQSAVQTIIELCDSLLNKIAESREIERRDYAHWLEEYSTSRGILDEKLQDLIREITNLQQEIAALNKRITNAQNEKAEQEVRQKEKQAQHDDRLKYCDDENVSYADRREERDDEREVVSDAVGLLQSHLRQFRAYVKDRLTTVKKAD